MKETRIQSLFLKNVLQYTSIQQYKNVLNWFGFIVVMLNVNKLINKPVQSGGGTISSLINCGPGHNRNFSPVALRIECLHSPAGHCCCRLYGFCYSYYLQGICANTLLSPHSPHHTKESNYRDPQLCTMLPSASRLIRWSLFCNFVVKL